ncbi:hypothetical protein [Vibrio alginolyticus]|uniref:hypothetical protein n=1 Tax=Vibrio alginolyticus TaxID=663 RepID=UPI000720B908|nr:hypothetical protein [Vibrio alginolyticus]ALR91309.1 hypothetical protein AT730_02480 [Vibrio alginolyticus]MBY7707980.1 hypothetical protein [Vibrio alginolyticus]
MFTLDIELDFTDLEKEVKEFNSHHIRVGVLDKNKMSSQPDRNASLKKFDQTGQASKYKKNRSGTGSLRLTELAKILDAKYGVFSKAESHFLNQDVVRVTNELISLFNAGGNPSSELIRRVETAARVLARNPIARKDFGSNDPETRRLKRFDWPMVDTGAFFSSIEAQYV